MAGKRRQQFSITNQRLDYCLRPDGLTKCSLFDWRMCWGKVHLQRRRSGIAAHDWNEKTLERVSSLLEDVAEPSDEILQELFQGLPFCHRLFTLLCRPAKFASVSIQRPSPTARFVGSTLQARPCKSLSRHQRTVDPRAQQKPIAVCSANLASV